MKKSILNGLFVAVLMAFAMFTLCSVSTYAQPKYGINSITTVAPPYPITLDGYVAEGGTKISLQILPTDITLSQYPVLLKLVIKGNGITLESKSLTIHEPVYLNGNEFLTLNGSDLQAFFNPDNLNFSGYSKTLYQRNGRLPEGVYTVGFELYDVIRKIPVASVRSTIVFLFLNEVPALTLPMNEQMISAAGTQTVNFRWTTRHSPLAATFFVPEYVFELWEITPAGRNPYDIVKGTRPLYATTLSSPYLAYGIAEPQLQPGKSYAWRVRESDPENRTLFKNNGYTEVYTFTYGRNCPAPELSADKVGTSHLSVNWKADINEKEFELRYREKKKKNAEWYSQSTNLLSGKVDNLKQNTVYEVEVCAVCGDQRSEYSNRLEINTRQNTSFKCGQIDSSRLPQNKNPLRKLSSGDIFNAYGFDVQVKEVTGGTGTFTGKGYVLVPVLNFIKIEVKFDNIQLNEEYQLIGGEVRSIYNLKNSPDKKFGGKDDIFDDLTKLITGDEEKNKFDDMADKTIEVDSVKEIKLENGKVVITDVNGKTEEVSTTSNKIIAVKTEEGKEYVVDTSSGTIYSSGNSGQKAPVGSPSGSVTTAAQAGKGSTPKYSVSFLPHQLQECGFDYPSGKSPAANYEQVEITGKLTLVPWKSTQAGRIERVVAEIAGGPADSVRYYRESNNVVMTAPGIKANQQQIMLNGLGKNEEDKLYAWYAAYNQGDTSKTYSRVLAGRLNTVSYEKKAIKVVLVPVNNSSCPRADYVQSELNTIYKSAVVEWIVLNGENITVPLAGGANAVFDNTDKDANMNYTPDMKAAINVFSNNPQYNRETYYLFFLDNAKDQTIKGYMPLKKQFGFIFKYNQYPDEYLRTIAHELGHGPFRLYHTFSDKNKYPQPEGATDNLMDYAAASATKLNKYQWDWVHDPEWRIYWGEDEEEGVVKVKAKKGTKVGYVVSSSQANIRNTIAPYKLKIPEELLEKGKEVSLVKTLVDKKIITVKYVNETVEYITSISNVTEIIKLDTKEKYQLLNDEESVKLPYSDVKTGNISKKESYVTVDKVCGDYYQVKENSTTNEGWWIMGKSLKRVDKDVDKNFDWTNSTENKVTTLDNSKKVEKAVLDKIKLNRDGVNDRTNSDIYGSNIIRHPVGSQNGWVYQGKETATPNIEGNSFVKKVREKLWQELLKEGNTSSINAWDGQHFTWGKGFAAGGQLGVLIENLLKNEKYKQIFQNMGIQLVGQHLWVVDDDGNWLKDVPNPKKADDMTGYKASIYIQNSTKMLSFFAEFAEKPDYCQDFVNAQYNILKTGTLKIPDYVLTEQSTSYKDNWNDESTVILFHLSYWSGASWVKDKYKNEYEATKGHLNKVLYAYIYQSVVNFSSMRTAKYETNLYKWDGGNRSYRYWFLDHLEDFGIPAGGGWTEFDNTWGNNLVELDFELDKNKVTRAVRTNITTDSKTKVTITIKDYITNSECVLIKQKNESNDKNYYVITKDGAAITTNAFEAQ